MNDCFNIDVLFTPAEFGTLEHRNLSNVACVVFDVLRATSSMVVALTNGAEAIIPCSTIEEALDERRKDPKILLGGERDGVRIRAGTGNGFDFDLGNSPREYTKDRVSGRKIAVTTTNGTRALRACAKAQKVLVGSLLNLSAAEKAVRSLRIENVVIVCSGTYEEAAYEDTFAAGAFCSLFAGQAAASLTDSAAIALDSYESCRKNPSLVFERSKNARRLLSQPDLREDVTFCFRQDSLDVTAEMYAGIVRRT